MVVCPKCGSKLQYRKVLFLTNLNLITCQVCSSSLQVENKSENSMIGGVVGGLGGGLMTALLILWSLTSNLLFLVLIPMFFVALLLGSLLLVDRYVRVSLKSIDNRVIDSY